MGLWDEAVFLPMAARLPSTMQEYTNVSLADQEANRMKISNEEINRLMALMPSERGGQQRRGSTETTATDYGNAEAATIDISHRAQEIQQVKKAISQLPDVRADRVSVLKAQVESGTYNVSGEDIADLMIRRTLADNTAI